MKLNIIAATIAAHFLAEGMDDAGCTKLNKLQALAIEVGGTGFAFEEGACSVEIKGPEAAQQFITALDGEDCVDGYDVTHDGEETDDEDILSLPADTTFSVTIYLHEDYITYASEEADLEDEEVMESSDDASLVDRFEKFAGTTLKVGRMTVKGFPFDMNDSDGESLDMDCVDSDAAKGLAAELKKAGFKVKRVGKVGILVEGVGDASLVDRFEKFAGTTLKVGRMTVKGFPFDMNDSDGESLDIDAVDADAAKGLAKALRAAGFKAKRVGDVGILVEGVEQPRVLAEGHVRGIPVDDYGVQLDEVAKKVVVTSKGAKRVKMQCPKGFKFDAAAKACVKIAGDELAIRRKASVKALVSRKAGGNALKVRAAVKTKKAMKFRAAMGLK